MGARVVPWGGYPLGAPKFGYAAPIVSGLRLQSTCSVRRTQTFPFLLECLQAVLLLPLSAPPSTTAPIPKPVILSQLSIPFCHCPLDTNTFATAAANPRTCGLSGVLRFPGAQQTQMFAQSVHRLQATGLASKTRPTSCSQGARLGS